MTADEDLRPGVLFDVDGTLLDNNYLHVLAWWQAFRDTGHHLLQGALRDHRLDPTRTVTAAAR